MSSDYKHSSHYITWRDDMGHERKQIAPSARLAYRLWLNLPEGIRGILVVNGKQVETDKQPNGE